MAISKGHIQGQGAALLQDDQDIGSHKVVAMDIVAEVLVVAVKVGVLVGRVGGRVAIVQAGEVIVVSEGDITEGAVAEIKGAEIRTEPAIGVAAMIAKAIAKPKGATAKSELAKTKIIRVIARMTKTTANTTEVETEEAKVETKIAETEALVRKGNCFLFYLF